MTDLISRWTPPDLAGEWAFERTIADAIAERELHVSGTLTITAESGDRLTWHEEGTLHHGASQTAVWRTYLLEHRPTGWMMTFDDGRDFHPWSVGHEVIHGCGADTYRAVYTIGDDPRDGWSVRWACVGPAKDYVMTTTYRPIS